MPGSVNLVFGQNLRILCEERGSISEAARQLDISRVQMTRYISGQSFPKPAQLKRICDLFDVDARILLQPLDQLRDTSAAIAGRTTQAVPFLSRLQELAEPEVHVPNGIHQFVRPSIHNPAEFVTTLVSIRIASNMRTFRVMNALGMHVRRVEAGLFSLRESHGIVLSMGNSFVMLSTGRHPLFFGVSYFQTKYLHQSGFFPGSYYVMSPSRDPGVEPLLPLILRPLPQRPADILAAARRSGARPIRDMPEIYRKHLLPQSS